jgi:hypothetical protein
MPQRVFLFGAGASAAFSNATSLHMPIVSDFFKRSIEAGFLKEDMCHGLLNYVARRHRCTVRRLSHKAINLEELMSEVSDEMERRVERRFRRLRLRHLRSLDNSRLMLDHQLVFMIRWTLLKIQEGGAPEDYQRLVGHLRAEDALVSLNYDLLLDQALMASGRWFPNDGYGIPFDALYTDAEWVRPVPPTTSAWPLLKLHGSLNWLYPQAPAEHFRWTPRQTPPMHVFLHAAMVASIASSGWYDHTGSLEPPADIIDNVDLFSLIVPPLRRKSYDFFTRALSPVWSKAQAAFNGAAELWAIGYSLPVSDTMAIDLLKRAVSEGRLRAVRLVNRDPTSIAHYQHILGLSDVTLMNPDFSGWTRSL